MSDAATKAFVERMKNDEEFKARMMAAETVEARLALINAEGFDCTAAEIAAHAAEIEDIELGAVVGGSCGPASCGVAACGPATCGVAACGPASCEENYCSGFGRPEP